MAKRLEIMKKICFALATLAVLAGLSSCKKTSAPVSEGFNTIKACIDNSIETKVSYGFTAGSSVLYGNFYVGDQVVGTCKRGSEYTKVILQCYENPRTGEDRFAHFQIISPDNFSLQNGDLLSLYYTGSDSLDNVEENKLNNVSFASQDGSISGLANTALLAYTGFIDQDASCAFTNVTTVLYLNGVSLPEGFATVDEISVSGQGIKNAGTLVSNWTQQATQVYKAEYEFVDTQDGAITASSLQQTGNVVNATFFTFPGTNSAELKMTFKGKTADDKDITYEVKASTAATLLAGFYYNIKLAEGYSYVAEAEGDPVVGSQTGYLKNATYVHSELTAKYPQVPGWMENATEFLYYEDEDYTYYTGTKVVDFEKITDARILGVASAYEDNSTETKTQTLVVSSYSVYNLKATQTTSTQTYKVYRVANNDPTVHNPATPVGEFAVKTYGSVVTEYLEDAHPNCHNHYHGHGHGTSHGHGHGDTDNAGGGIILSD